MSFLQIEHASPLTCDRYDTPEVTPGLFTRLFPSLRFYRHMLKVVWVSGNQAKKHYSGDDWVTSSLGMLDALEYAGVRVHVEGVENFIKLESPCVFIGNHMSTLETFILPCLIQHDDSVPERRDGGESAHQRDHPGDLVLEQQLGGVLLAIGPHAHQAFVLGRQTE